MRSAAGRWRVRGIRGEITLGQVTLLVAGTRDERLAIVEAVSGRVIPSEGRALVTGVPLKRETACRIRRRVAVVDVSAAVGATWMTRGPRAAVFDDVDPHARPLEWHVALASARHALTRVGLMGRTRDCVLVTDRSARVRLEVARALIGGPEYVILAELDERLGLEDAGKLLQTLQAVAHQDRVGVLVTAASRDFEWQSIDRVLLLAGGRLLCDGPSPGPLAAEGPEGRLRNVYRRVISL